MTNVVLPGFEGAEKCLEVWFNPVVSPNSERQGLFKIKRFSCLFFLFYLAVHLHVGWNFLTNFEQI